MCTGFTQYACANETYRYLLFCILISPLQSLHLENISYPDLQDSDCTPNVNFDQSIDRVAE